MGVPYKQDTSTHKLYRQFFKASGGFGGFGGFGDEDEDMMPGRRGSPAGFSHIFTNVSGGMPGAMPRGARSSSAAFQTASPQSEPSEITRPLKVSLEDLFTGATKRLKVGRKLLSGGTDEKILEIEVQVSHFNLTYTLIPHMRL